MTSSTEFSDTHHTYVKEEVILSDGEDSGIVLDSTAVPEANSHLQSIKHVPHSKKYIDSTFNTTNNSKHVTKKNMIRVRNQDEETEELLDLDSTFPTLTSIPSLIHAKELIGRNGRSTPELANGESQDEADFEMSMATLDDYCSLLDIPDASENSEKKITECWIISDSDSDEDGAAVVNPYNSNVTLDPQMEEEANSDISNSLMETNLSVKTNSNIDKSTKSFEYDPNDMCDKKKFFHEVCIICKIKQVRKREAIVKNCQKCNASTSFQCLLCSAQPYHSLSSIYIHIVKVHQQDNVDVPKVECPRCKKLYADGRPIKDHLRRCKVEPHLMCSICKVSKFYQRNHLKNHMLTRHFDKANKLNIDNLVAQIVLKSHKLRVIEQNKAQLRYGGRSVSLSCKNPFSINKFTNGYCPKCDELFPPQPEAAAIMKYCINCSSQLIFQCVKCKKRSFTRTNMRLHLITKCARLLYDRVLRCEHCDFTAPHKNIIKTHIFRTHMCQDPKNRYKCRKCDKTYKVIYDRNYHQKSCGNVKMHDCEECPYQTKYRYRYLNHARLHLRQKNLAASRQNDGIGDKVADIPEYEEKQPVTEVRRIREPIVKPEPDPAPETLLDLVSRSLAAWCPHCKIEIPVPMPLSQWHMTKCESCHQAEFVYRCKLCSYRHLDMSTVVEHVTICHAKKIFDCHKNCGAKFNNVKDLRNHEQICGKVFRCRYCSYAATNMNTIRKHIKQANCGMSGIPMRDHVVKPETNGVEDAKDAVANAPLRMAEAKLPNFKPPAKLKPPKQFATRLPCAFKPTMRCSKCDKVFKNLTKFLRHQDRCGKVKQLFYYCDHCSFKTNVKATLESHIQSKHAARLFRGVTAFRCDSCPKVFRNYFIYYKHTEEECRYRV